MIARINAARAETQPRRRNFVPNGTTTGPAVPRRPLWMCAARGGPILFSRKTQQTLRVFAFSLMIALPLPFGSPLGRSAAPDMRVVIVAWLGVLARASAGTR